MKKSKIIDIRPYGGRVRLFALDPSEIFDLADEIEQFMTVEEDDTLGLIDNTGLARTYSTDMTNFAVAIFAKANLLEMFRIIDHELTHVCLWLLCRRGILIDGEQSEPLAYLHDDLMSQCMPIVAEWLDYDISSLQ